MELYKTIRSEKKEYVLTNQLLRCGTSIGANVAEANGAISDIEFSAKLSIAYKEALESKYWLSLLKDTNFITEEAFRKIYDDADELARILFSIIKKMRIEAK